MKSNLQRKVNAMKNGLIAGFAATAVLSAIMIMKSMMGVMPDVNAIKMMAGMIAEKTGMTNTIPIAWIMHFVIGTLAWGGGYSLLQGMLPGSSLVKGILFGVGAWLIMMLVVMPMTGEGLFGLNIGPHATMATLMLHVIFGAVLGTVYGRLSRAE